MKMGAIKFFFSNAHRSFLPSSSSVKRLHPILSIIYTCPSYYEVRNSHRPSFQRAQIYKAVKSVGYNFHPIYAIHPKTKGVPIINNGNGNTIRRQEEEQEEENPLTSGP